MQGHEGDDAAVVVVVGDLVAVGDQRDAFEEVGEGALGVGLLELGRHRLELGEVLDPALVLRVGRGLQLGEVPRLLEHGLQHRAGPEPDSTSVRRLSTSWLNASIEAIERVARPIAS